MDWAIVGTVGSVISAALGGGFFTNWLALRRQRRDKLEERKLLRDEGFRSDLRHGYAAFVASCSKLLVLARDKAIILNASQNSRSPAPGEFLPLTRADEHIQLRNEFSAAKVDAEIRLAELMLLEDDARFQELLDGLWGAIADLRSPNTENSYVEELKSCQGDLDALLRLCATTFSPSGWDKRMNRVESFLATQHEK